MRLPLATDLKTRTGAPDKDARLKNCYVESKGPNNDPNNPPQTAIRRRPSAQGGISVGTGTAQGGINGIFVYGDVLYPVTQAMLTTCNNAASYSIGDHVTVNMVDYWATTNHIGNCPIGSGNSDWSTSYVPPYYQSPTGLGNVSIFFTSSGILTAENSSALIGQLTLAGYSGFGNPIQFNGPLTFATLFIAFTAVRNSDSANVVIIMDGSTFSDIAAGYSTIQSNITAGFAKEIILNSTNFPLIGSGITVAADIGAFTFFAFGFGNDNFQLVVYGTHPNDGTTRYYALNSSGTIVYVTDSTTINTTWNNLNSRITYIYGSGFVNYVNRSSYLKNTNGINPVTGATVVSKATIAYDPTYGWLAIDKFGYPGGKIAISGTDWIIYQNGNFAYFVGIYGQVYVIDLTNFDTGSGLSINLTVTLAINSGGTYLDSRIDDSLNVYASYTTAGNNYINSNGTVTPATNIPHLTTGDIARRRYSIKGRT